ncbi:hypothetical protein [Streptomyces sp. Tue6028]|uniref:hypothetical protein n=1 Tax=Streptomyces sp. Tue6028 TaxID=2036037 RepID=UPI003D75AEC7
MFRLIPLRVSLDDSGLAHAVPATLPDRSAAADTTTRPVQGAPMLGHTVTITADEMREIFARLQPHLPPYLRKVEPNTYNTGLRYEFAPFTGREETPSTPSAFYNDPQLGYVGEDADPREHTLRQAAKSILTDLYDRAYEEWKDAAYVADLQDVVRDAPDRWRAYERELKALESAYAYLRSPEAAQEWPSAICRLVDAQHRAGAAAVAFDERAREIADVHEKHLYSDLDHGTALSRAGHPDGGDWHIVCAHEYGARYYSDHNTGVPLQEIVRRLTDQQDAHITKVSSLAGLAAG